MDSYYIKLGVLYRKILETMARCISAPWGVYYLTAFLLLVHYQWVHDFEFVGDSVFLISGNKFMENLSYFWGNLTHNYFWSSSGFKVPYWRPVTKVSWLFEYQLFGPWAGGYQWVQVAWYLVAIAGVLRLAGSFNLAKHLLIFIAAYLSVSIIAIGPVTMVMARSDVVALACSLWSFIYWHKALHKNPLCYLHHVLFAILALGSKESSVSLLPMMASWIVLQEAEKRRKLATYGSLIPLCVLTALYIYLRHQVLLNDEKEMAKMAVSIDPMRIFASCALYIQNLLPFKMTSTVRDIPFAEAKSFAFIAQSFVTYAVVGLLSIPLIKRRDVFSLFLFIWLLLALAPVLLPAEIYIPGNVGRYNLADRWLFHALPASALLMARWLSWHPRLFPRRIVLLLTALGVCTALSRSHHNFLDFKDELGFLKNEDQLYYFSVPEPYRSQDDHCRYYDRQVVRALLLEQYQKLVQLSQVNWQRCGPGFERGLNWLNGLLRFSLCDDGKDLAGQLLAQQKLQGGVYPVHANLAQRCVDLMEKQNRPEEKQFWIDFQRGINTPPNHAETAPPAP